MGMSDTYDQTGSAAELTEEQLEFLGSMFDLARQGEQQQLLALIDQGFPADTANDKGDSLLILAAYNGHTSLVRSLLARGADPNRVNDRGQTALSCSVFKQDEEITAALLEAGANPALGAQSAVAVADMFGLQQMRRLLQQP